MKSERGTVSEHIRTNVVGYISLFCFAIGGTAMALPGINSIDSGDIRNRNVRARDIALNAVGAGQVRDGSIRGAEVVETSLDGAVLQRRVAGSCGPAEAIRSVGESGTVTCVTVVTGGTAPAGPAGGDLTGTYPDPTVAANAIASPELAAGSVTGSEIATGAVGSTEIAADSVGSSEIASNAVGDAEIAGSSVEAGEVTNFTLRIADLLSQPPSSPGTTTLPNLADGDCDNFNAATSFGVDAGDLAIVVPNTLQQGTSLQGLVTTGSAVRARFCNFSGSSISPSFTYTIYVFGD